MASPLDLVRREMASLGVDALVVFSSDAHMSEYVHSRDEKRAFVSGFTGSAGTAVLTREAAALWTDGRYHLQALQQLDGDSWVLMRQGEEGVPTECEWLKRSLAAGASVAFDPHCVSQTERARLEKELEGSSLVLSALERDIVADVWEGLGRPPFPLDPLKLHPERFAGRSASDKLRLIGERLDALDCGVGMMLVSALDEVAWLFNIRGSDIQYNPLCFAYAIVPSKAEAEARGLRPALFVDPRKVPAAAMAQLEALCDVHGYGDASDVLLARLGATDRKVLMDPSVTNAALVAAATTARCELRPSPIAIEKARKTAAEVEGLAAAHLRDGAALTAWFCWLEGAVAGGQQLTEVSVADKLREFRARNERFVDLSFATISATGANGAIIHYHPQKGTNDAPLGPTMYLVDSGAQYEDGTTDVTRTFHFGEPTAHEKRCFTAVLQGTIALSAAVFPKGTEGSRLDSMARLPLWQLGLDYKHGTGHGVGAFLNVHEGPQAISFRKRRNEAGFEAGMTTSIEPGYYEEGGFGIRIENVVVTEEAPTMHRFDGRVFCRFRTLTLAPISRKLIDMALLSERERAWVDDYHREVREKLKPVMEASGYGQEAISYLERETEPLGDN